ncbi:hypothetical protein FXO37_33313 [Capsicum annuum]|nr:hypothetical protein FXO37_33313 [Capsicum annuum]
MRSSPLVSQPALQPCLMQSLKSVAKLLTYALNVIDMRPRSPLVKGSSKLMISQKRIRVSRISPTLTGMPIRDWLMLRGLEMYLMMDSHSHGRNQKKDYKSNDKKLIEKTTLKYPLRNEAKHATPYKFQGLKESGNLKVIRKVVILFKFENYHDEVHFDMIPKQACHLLLGRPRQYDCSSKYDGRIQTRIMGGPIANFKGPGPWMYKIAAGNAYAFPPYSLSLKLVLGFSQQQLTIIGVANDIGENVGILSSIACNKFPPWVILLMEENEQMLISYTLRISSASTSSLTLEPIEDEVFPISIILDLSSQVQTFPVEGKISLPDHLQCHFEVNITDTSDIITAIVSRTEAEIILSLTAKQIYQNIATQIEPLSIVHTNQHLAHKLFRIQLQKPSYRFLDQTPGMLAVTSFTEVENPDVQTLLPPMAPR